MRQGSMAKISQGRSGSLVRISLQMMMIFWISLVPFIPPEMLKERQSSRSTQLDSADSSRELHKMQGPGPNKTRERKRKGAQISTVKVSLDKMEYWSFLQVGKRRELKN